MSKRTKKTDVADDARKPVVYETKVALAKRLDVSRQAVNSWVKAEWWPVTTDGPWTEDDVLAIQDAHAEQDGDDPRDDVARRWKESQIIRNRASTLRILRESAKELGQLVDAEAVAKAFRSAMNGGACTVALQESRWAITMGVVAWLSAKGIALDDADRSRLDQVVWDEQRNPVESAIRHALEHLADDGFGDNSLAKLIDQLKDLAASVGERVDATPRWQQTDAVARLVDKLRVVRGDRVATEDAKLLRCNQEVACASIATDPLLATVVAELAMQDDWQGYVAMRAAKGLPLNPTAAVKRK